MQTHIQKCFSVIFFFFQNTNFFNSHEFNLQRNTEPQSSVFITFAQFFPQMNEQ